MVAAVPLADGVLLRPLTVDDAAALLDAYLRSRDHLLPFEPVRPASFWTLAGQRARLETMVLQMAQGRQLACVMLRDGGVLGCATLNEIVLGPFRSASLGYWVAPTETGRGLATRAVAALCRVADQEIGLHRIQASTNLGNVASQRVLTKSGFERFGTARDYLHINGRWQDAHLYQRILNDRPPSTG
jgi:[ribosomal protein S5]-alanine N-acetyltransferase